MDLQISWQGAKNIKRFDNMISALSEDQQKLVYVRSINRAGQSANTKVRRALAKQTGLRQKDLPRYVAKPRKATLRHLRYEIRARGGDVPLKLFKAREVRGGVTAAPFGKRTKFDNHFITSGKPGRRFSLTALGGHVYEADASTTAWGRPFTKAKSGVVVPVEIVQDNSAQAFTSTAGPVLERRIEHELKRILL